MRVPLQVVLIVLNSFYLDVYEALGNLLIIPVALNNIKYRADVNSMNPIEKNVSSLEDFIKLTKATRFHYCINTEVYTDFLDVVVNAKLRNAIGHNDVEYDAVSQLITYIPNPRIERRRKLSISLNLKMRPCICFKVYWAFQSIYIA